MSGNVRRSDSTLFYYFFIFSTTQQNEDMYTQYFPVWHFILFLCLVFFFRGQGHKSHFFSCSFLLFSFCLTTENRTCKRNTDQEVQGCWRVWLIDKLQQCGSYSLKPFSNFRTVQTEEIESPKQACLLTCVNQRGDFSCLRQAECKSWPNMNGIAIMLEVNSIW